MHRKEVQIKFYGFHVIIILDDTSVKSITTGISNLALIPKRKTQDRPAKEGHGRKIQVETNHLALRMKNTSVVVYHYDVAITPDKPFKFYR